MTQAVDLYLASKSPRRRELLDQIGVRYQCISIDVPEQRDDGETPEQYVQRLSASKASAGWRQLHVPAPVLGADTIVVCGQQVLEKPAHEVEALRMLMALSGCTHQVITAVSVCSANRCETRMQTTTVTFRTITAQEARRYWQTGEPVDKAGGYGIQGLGGIFVERIEGSYSSVMGLPLHETWQLLQAFSVPAWCVQAE